MTEKAKRVPELGDDVPGLARVTGHIVARMSIALDDVLEGVHDREWFLETMRQDIRYYVWLYASTRQDYSDTSGTGGT